MNSASLTTLDERERKGAPKSIYIYIYKETFISRKLNKKRTKKWRVRGKRLKGEWVKGI
jgi:hypothetical protein